MRMMRMEGRGGRGRKRKTSLGCEGITFCGLEICKAKSLWMAVSGSWCVGVKKSKLTMTPIVRRSKSCITARTVHV